MQWHTITFYFRIAKNESGKLKKYKAEKERFKTKKILLQNYGKEGEWEINK